MGKAGNASCMPKSVSSLIPCWHSPQVVMCLGKGPFPSPLLGGGEILNGLGQFLMGSFSLSVRGLGTGCDPVLGSRGSLLGAFENGFAQ